MSGEGELPAGLSRLRDEIHTAVSAAQGTLQSLFAPGDYPTVQRAKADLFGAAVNASIAAYSDVDLARELYAEIGEVWDGEERIARHTTFEELVKTLAEVPEDELRTIPNRLRSEPFTNVWNSLAQYSPYNQE